MAPQHAIRHFVRLVLEAERDAKELMKLNAGSLKRDGFTGDHNELQLRSQKGPIFDERTIGLIHDVRPPDDDRKRFIRWLANQLTDASNEQRPSRSEIEGIVDFINATGDRQYLDGNFDAAYRRGRDWHHEIQSRTDDELQIKDRNEDVVFSWPDGWRVVRVPATDCNAEGSAMGHCVAGYASSVAGGHTHIFSLRDPKGRPHVTVEASRDGYGRMVVLQIKGKQNRAPVAKHAERIKEWLSTTDWDYLTCADFIDIASPEEIDTISEDFVGKLIDDFRMNDGVIRLEGPVDRAIVKMGTQFPERLILSVLVGLRAANAPDELRRAAGAGVGYTARSIFGRIMPWMETNEDPALVAAAQDIWRLRGR